MRPLFRAGFAALKFWGFLGTWVLGLGISLSAAVYETTSAYHHIRIIDQGGTRILSFNGSEETRMSLDDPLSGHFGYTEFFQVPVVWNTNLTNVLMIGLGGGSMQRAYQYYHPKVSVDTVEIDPSVIIVAKQYFSVKESGTHRISNSDGRVYLQRSPKKYDAIFMDAYRTGRYGSSIPHHMVTQEFFQLASKKLTTNGVLMYNVIGTVGGWRADVVGAVHRTLQSVFPQVYMFPAGDSRNIVMLATKSNALMPATTWRKNFDALLKAGHEFPPGFRTCLEVCNPRPPPSAARAPVLLDKFAPVDGLLFGAGN